MILQLQFIEREFDLQVVGGPFLLHCIKGKITSFTILFSVGYANFIEIYHLPLYCCIDILHVLFTLNHGADYLRPAVVCF